MSKECKKLVIVWNHVLLDVLIEDMINSKILKMAAIAGIASVIGIVVFSIVSLVPKYVTESVTVVSVDSSGCTVETSDKFIVKISSCNAKPGETIATTYDEKIKERYMALNMHQ